MLKGLNKKESLNLDVRLHGLVYGSRTERGGQEKLINRRLAQHIIIYDFP